MRKTIAILTVEEFDFNKYGGFGMVAKTIAKMLKEEKINTVIIDVSQGESLNPKFSDGVPVYFIRKKQDGIFKQIAEEIISFFRLVQTVKKLNISTLICISEWVAEYCILLKYFCPNTKRILWFQDIRTEEDWRKIFTVEEEKRIVCGDHPKRFWWILRIKKFLRKYSIRRMNLCLAQSHYLQEKAIQVYSLKKGAVKTLPNPVRVPDISKIKKSNYPIVIFLGRLDPIKRPWLFCELARRFPEVQFLVMGISHFPKLVNPKLQSFRKLKNLQFLGLITGMKKEEILRRSWILVNTSIYESLPVSFLEALANRMAILSCQNPDNIVSRFGYYTGPPTGEDEEVEKFQKGLSFLLEKNHWVTLGSKGYQYIKEVADYETIKTQIISIL